MFHASVVSVVRHVLLRNRGQLRNFAARGLATVALGIMGFTFNMNVLLRREARSSISFYNVEVILPMEYIVRL